MRCPACGGELGFAGGEDRFAVWICLECRARFALAIGPRLDKPIDTAPVGYIVPGTGQGVGIGGNVDTAPTPVAEPEAVKHVTVSRPCPFCGGQGVMYRVLRDGCKDGEADAWAYYVRCRSCDAEGGWGKSEGSGLRWWNTRPAPTAEQRAASVQPVAQAEAVHGSQSSQEERRCGDCCAMEVASYCRRLNMSDLRATDAACDAWRPREEGSK